MAEELKLQLGADVEEIIEPKGRGGLMGWVRSGKESSQGTIVPINPSKLDPSGYNIVAIGTPIWAWNVSSPVRSYIVAMKGKMPKVAFFCCMDGKPGETFKVMEMLSGRTPVATAEFKRDDVKSGVFKEAARAFAEKVKATP